MGITSAIWINNNMVNWVVGDVFWRNNVVIRPCSIAEYNGKRQKVRDKSFEFQGFSLWQTKYLTDDISPIKTKTQVISK
jgi:hypothetical protein